VVKTAKNNQFFVYICFTCISNTICYAEVNQPTVAELHHLLRACSETLLFIAFCTVLSCEFVAQFLVEIWIFHVYWTVPSVVHFSIHETVNNHSVTAIRSCTLHPFHPTGSNETAACKPSQPTTCQKVLCFNLFISLPILWTFISYC